MASVVGMDIAVNPGRCVTLAVAAGHVKVDRAFSPCAVLRRPYGSGSQRPGGQ
jgi:hypothetical protein